MKQIIVCLLFLLALGSCGNKHNLKELDEYTQGQIGMLNSELTKVIVSDIFTPPVCSRIYAYPNIAAYQVLRNQDNEYKTLVGHLTDLSSIPSLEANKKYYLPVASAIAFTSVANHLVYDQEKIQTLETQYLSTIETIGIDDEVLQNSIAYGRKVGEHILIWANKDGYLQRTAMPDYSVDESAGTWKPTPPDYMPAIEPNWNTLRPFVLDSANQYAPLHATLFDSTDQSLFYKETMEVYEAVNNATKEQLAMAKFWDCNPNISHTQGHLTFFDQKISPGGHWISITTIATKKAQLDLLEATKVHALVSITLADAFISCWDEKYNSSLIRPETYINRYIDVKWKPILQTPAFPEYTSGHSVASASAATVLTELLGDSFQFVDSTEVEYGLPVRTFPSFFAASDEAAISRLYGGIHYMPAITNGVAQGKAVGNHVIDRIILE